MERQGLNVSKIEAEVINERLRTVMDENGQEIPDQTELSLPMGMKRPDKLKETMRRLIKQELSDIAAAQGYETLDEANDFDVSDDFDVDEPATPYALVEEEEFIPPEPAKPSGAEPADVEAPADDLVDLGVAKAVDEPVEEG